MASTTRSTPRPPRRALAAPGVRDDVREIAALPVNPRPGWTESVLALLSEVPTSEEGSLLRASSATRIMRAQMLTREAARRAALTAGALALPPGPLGWMTVLPELLAIWRIQAQLVADLAAIHGVRAQLTREHMLYCLFRHTAAQAMRDLVVRVGQRVLVERLSRGALRALVRRIGGEITRRSATRAVARWMPVVGAAGVAAYAWFDTRQVSATTLSMLQGELDETPLSGA